MKHDAWTEGVIVSIEVISNLRFSRRRQTGLSQFLLASDCHIKLKHFEASFSYLLYRKGVNLKPYSEGISNQAVV